MDTDAKELLDETLGWAEQRMLKETPHLYVWQHKDSGKCYIKTTKPLADSTYQLAATVKARPSTTHHLRGTE